MKVFGFRVLISAFSCFVTDQSRFSKQSKDDEEEANAAEDREYEEWKQRILESAAKAMQSTGKKDKDKSNS